MNILVLFGVTGDLARKKVIPALADFGADIAGSDHVVIGIGRKAAPPAEFATLKRRAYVAGELDSISTYKKLKKEIRAIARNAASAPNTPKVRLIAYSSLPPHMHVMVARLFAEHVIGAKNALLANEYHDMDFRFLFEKPIGSDLASATRDIATLHAIFNPTKLFFVDHYLFKEPLTALRDATRLHPQLFADTIGADGLASVEAVLYDSVDVSGRGAFYDAVGALNDIGQNHLLQMLAEFIMMREWIRSQNPAQSAPAGKKSPTKAKAQIISSLKIVNDPVFGQYAGYSEVEGVKAGSKTETFFRIEATYGDLRCAVSGGKGLGIRKSGLILRNRKHGTEIFIDMDESKSPCGSYASVFRQAIAGNRSAFAQESEIIAGWKFARRAKQIRTSKIIVYRSLRDIIDK